MPGTGTHEGDTPSAHISDPPTWHGCLRNPTVLRGFKNVDSRSGLGDGFIHPGYLGRGMYFYLVWDIATTAGEGQP